jgi:sialic acid synthase SpsE
MRINIDKKQVGDGCPCYIIAEIGSNHNNEYKTAIELIDAASDCGADAVKIQTFSANKHYSKFTPKIYQGSEKKCTDPYQLIESLEMNREWIPKLAKYALSKSIHLFSSPCDLDAVKLLNSLDSPVYKVSSFDITDMNLIENIAKIGKPVILSTGLANYEDIQRAVNKCNDVGNDNIILLQCTSVYPAPVELSNLKAIQTMRNTFNLISGYSDHTEGGHISLAAVALGASIIEKHFTLDSSSNGPDHFFAIEPSNLKKMVCNIRDIESSIGDGVKNGPRDEEIELYKKARRSLHAADNINKGDVITESMLCIKRPSFGISPHLIDLVIGREAKQDIDMDKWITWSDI